MDYPEIPDVIEDVVEDIPEDGTASSWVESQMGWLDLDGIQFVEVLDENRLLVDKTFRQCVEAFGVNADGYFNDHYMNSPGAWFVRYKKFNVDNFENYMVIGENYYLMINDKLIERNENTRQYKRAIRSTS